MKLKIIPILLSIFSLVNVSPTPIRFWIMGEESQLISENYYVLNKIITPSSSSSLDLATQQDCLFVGTDSVSIAGCLNPFNDIKWQSGESWQVTEAIAADLNRDGSTELAMVVWRPHQPWPIDSFLPHGGRISSFHDQQGLSCHLILVGWDGKKYRELWAGSSLVDPVSHIRAIDLDSDGFQELVALEGKYDSTSLAGTLTLWEWAGFGFRLIDRLETHLVSEFGIVSSQQDVMIISN